MKREPALITSGIISALVILGTTFGIDMPEGAEATLQSAAVVILALITRSQVTPVDPS
jgi:hypothetical protein